MGLMVGIFMSRKRLLATHFGAVALCSGGADGRLKTGLPQVAHGGRLVALHHIA